MEKQERIERIKKHALKVGYITILSTILFLGISYAWLSLTLTGTKTNVLKSGNLSLVLDDTMGEGITIQNGVPMHDEVGLIQDPYTFTLTNNGTIDSEYTIYLDDVDLLEGETKLPDNVIKYGLKRDSNQNVINLLSATGENPNRVLDTGMISPGETYAYKLRLWVSGDAGNEVMGQVFRGKIRVVATQVQEKPPTESGCFVYTTTGNEVTITDYKCYEGNPDGMPVITDVAIPRLIEGVETKSISGPNSNTGAFQTKGLTSIVIPDGVTNIGDHAFEDNQLTSVDIPNSITKINYYAFRKNQLSDIKIPNSVLNIGIGAFEYNNLKRVVIPDSVTSIGSWAFARNQLTSIKLSKGLTRIESNTFLTNQLTTVDIPENVTSIGGDAFVSNQITSVKLPKGLKYLDGFRDNKLTSIDIPEGVTTLGTFKNNQLTEVTIPESVTSLGNSVFEANKLTTIVIPDSVTSIGDWAFKNNQLTSVKLSKGLTSIPKYAFQYNQLSSIDIPSAVTNIGDLAFGSNQLTNVTILGKSSTTDFTTFGTDVFGWASGYSDANITWQP